ncbi:hypothetical protein EYM_03730 [Ignicoccus islandicus DSM 13165]|uniref:Aspartokinase n=1 Tax=Ignicoccus islandicus DSM 13165 TaxID=940295 RepID=A0A0U3F4G5_9CREN|nr:aspartate kinase [Ignicoccus islandicus]ALU12437.1 hypothetical protein EYM_03730 [Ignicoccus islandicus DSM 13165]
MRVVSKFGGSVLRDVEGYRKAAQIVKELLNDTENEVVVVVSAMKGITDSLLRVSENPHRGWREYLRALQRRHERVLDQLNADEKWKESLRELFDNLNKVLWALEILKESTPRTKDYILSFGERSSSVLMAAALESVGIDAEPVFPERLGIYVEGEPPNVTILYDMTFEKVRENLGSILSEGRIPVATGFLGINIEGVITNLGRGGSDLTATILGAALNADEVRLYTDVDGIKTANPREFKEAVTIPELSLYEAIELARLGAKRLHPKTFEPLLRRPTDVRILSLYNPHGSSTLISYKKQGPNLKAVAVMNDLALISVKGVGMVEMKGTAAKVMEACAKVGANIYAISQPISETSITIAVNKGFTDIVAKAVKNSLGLYGIDVEVDIKPDVSAVSIVGKGLEEPTYVSNVLRELPNEPVLLVTKGPSDLSLTIFTTHRAARSIASSFHKAILKEMEKYYGVAK